MNELFNGIDYVRTYMVNLLIISSNKCFENLIKNLDKVHNALKSAGFKENAEKSFFARNALKYPGLKITRQGMMPLADKVEAIKNIAVPTAKK